MHLVPTGKELQNWRVTQRNMPRVQAVKAVQKSCCKGSMGSVTVLRATRADRKGVTKVQLQGQGLHSVTCNVT